MKDVIIVTLLFFAILSWNYQPYMDEINGVREQYIQTVANTAISEAKIKGYFTSSDLTNIQDTVADHLGYPAQEITVSGTTILMTRGEPINLSISLPSIVNLFSVSPSTNHVTLAANASADSEALVS